MTHVKCPACGAVFGGSAAELPRAPKPGPRWCEPCKTVHPEGKHTRPQPLPPHPVPPEEWDDVTPTEDP